jgi:hypothetical protein
MGNVHTQNLDNQIRARLDKFKGELDDVDWRFFATGEVDDDDWVTHVVTHLIRSNFDVTENTMNDIVKEWSFGNLINALRVVGNDLDALGAHIMRTYPDKVPFLDYTDADMEHHRFWHEGIMNVDETPEQFPFSEVRPIFTNVSQTDYDAMDAQSKVLVNVVVRDFRNLSIAIEQFTVSLSNVLRMHQARLASAAGHAIDDSLAMRNIIDKSGGVVQGVHEDIKKEIQDLWHGRNDLDDLLVKRVKRAAANRQVRPLTWQEERSVLRARTRRRRRRRSATTRRPRRR